MSPVAKTWIGTDLPLFNGQSKGQEPGWRQIVTLCLMIALLIGNVIQEVTESCLQADYCHFIASLSTNMQIYSPRKV